jgi:hypothetical protein
MKARRAGIGIGVMTLAGALLNCGSGAGDTGSGAGDAGSGARDAGIMPAPESCGTVDPCGGDPTGTWKVLGGCITPAEVDDGNCAEETFKLTTLSYTGTVTFGPNMTYTTSAFTEDRGEIAYFPSACLPPNSDETCADQDMAYKLFVKGSGSATGSAGCAGSTTCTCTVSETGMPVIGDSGVYSIQGTELTFRSSPSPSTTYTYGPFSYCVQNGLLHLIDAATTIDSMGAEMTVVYEDIVAQME